MLWHCNSKIPVVDLEVPCFCTFMLKLNRIRNRHCKSLFCSIEEELIKNSSLPSPVNKGLYNKSHYQFQRRKKQWLISVTYNSRHKYTYRIFPSLALSHSHAHKHTSIINTYTDEHSKDKKEQEWKMKLICHYQVKKGKSGKKRSDNHKFSDWSQNKSNTRLHLVINP